MKRTSFLSPLLIVLALAGGSLSAQDQSANAALTTPSQGPDLSASAINSILSRASRRAALGQWWTSRPHWDSGLGVTPIPPSSTEAACDGADVWVSSLYGMISRVRASDGKLLDSWTGAISARQILVAMGRIFTIQSDLGEPGLLYMIDPSQPAGAVTTVTGEFGSTLSGLAFDGSRLWACGYTGVSIITPGATLPWSVTTKTVSPNALTGMVFDGRNIWVTDSTAGNLLKLDGQGNVIQTVALGTSPASLIFDGVNLWVLNGAPVGNPTATITVVRASDGAIVASLSGNGLGIPLEAAFDGERVLVSVVVANPDGSIEGAVSIWRAADLSPLGTMSFGRRAGTSEPNGVCSDGINFWVTNSESNLLGRF